MSGKWVDRILRAITPAGDPITFGHRHTAERLLLNSSAKARNFPAMKTRIQITALAIAAFSLATPALADCLVKYKAKQDNPLKLEAGEMVLPADACTSPEAAQAAVAARLAETGWTVLSVTLIDG